MESTRFAWEFQASKRQVHSPIREFTNGRSCFLMVDNHWILDSAKPIGNRRSVRQWLGCHSIPSHFAFCRSL